MRLLRTVLVLVAALFLAGLTLASGALDRGLSREEVRELHLDWAQLRAESQRFPQPEPEPFLVEVRDPWWDAGRSDENMPWMDATMGELDSSEWLELELLVPERQLLLASFFDWLDAWDGSPVRVPDERSSSLSNLFRTAMLVSHRTCFGRRCWSRTGSRNAWPAWVNSSA